MHFRNNCSNTSIDLNDLRVHMFSEEKKIISNIVCNVQNDVNKYFLNYASYDYRLWYFKILTTIIVKIRKVFFDILGLPNDKLIANRKWFQIS